MARATLTVDAGAVMLGLRAPQRMLARWRPPK
jgi:hypothetical protein